VNQLCPHMEPESSLILNKSAQAKRVGQYLKRIESGTGLYDNDGHVFILNELFQNAIADSAIIAELTFSPGFLLVPGNPTHF